MSNNNNKTALLSRFAEYEQDVESTILSDSIDTTDRDSNVVSDTDDSNTSETSTEVDSDTSDEIYSDTSDEMDSELSDDFEIFGQSTSVINTNAPNYDPNYVLGMYNRATNIPILDPMYHHQLLEYGRDITGDPLLGLSNRSCRVYLDSRNSEYLNQVIRTHNGLQDLLKAMCDDAINILKIDVPKVQVIHIDRSDFNMNHYGNFVDKLCQHKKSMLRTMDLVNSVYNTIVDHLNRNPDERSENDSKKLAIINYNWNHFLANYLPLVPTPEDEEYFRRTGAHRQINSNDILPKIDDGSGKLQKALIGGGSLEDTNAKAQDVMRRVRSFVSGQNKDGFDQIKIDPIPLSIADEDKRSALMSKQEQEVEQEVVGRTHRTTDPVVKPVELQKPEESIEAQEPINVVRNVQSLDGKNNLNRTMTVPDFTVEYSDEINIDSKLGEYTQNINVNTKQRGALEKTVADLHRHIDYDYSSLDQNNVKVISEPMEDSFREQVSIKEKIIKYEELKSITQIINRDLKDVFFKNADIIQVFEDIVRINPSGRFIPGEFTSVIDFLEQAKSQLSGTDINLNYIEQGLSTLKRRGKGLPIPDIQIEQLDGTDKADRLIASLNISDPRIRDIEFRYDIQGQFGTQKSKGRIRDLPGKLKEYNKYMRSKGLLNKIDEISEIRSRLETVQIPELKSTQNILQKLDAMILASIGAIDESKIPDEPIIKTIKEINVELSILEAAQNDITINELIAPEDLVAEFEDKIYAETEALGVHFRPEKLVKQFGGDDTDELKAKLKNVERDMRKMSHSLFSTISSLDNSKMNHVDMKHLTSEINRLSRSMRDHLSLISSISVGITSEELPVLKYLRLHVLLDAKRDFQKIIEKTDEYSVTLRKMIKLIERLEHIVGENADGYNVVEISTDDQYTSSVVPLVILYFVIVFIQSPDQQFVDALSKH